MLFHLQIAFNAQVKRAQLRYAQFNQEPVLVSATSCVPAASHQACYSLQTKIGRHMICNINACMYCISCACALFAVQGMQRFSH